MEDLLKSLAGGESPPKKEKVVVEKNKDKKKTKVGAIEFLKTSKKTKYVRISDAHHKKMMLISKKNKISITSVLEKLIAYALEKNNL